VSAGANWLAALWVPLAVFVVCLAVDLSASDRLTSDVGRGALLCLMAAVLQILFILSVAPWWGASLPARTAFGAVIAAGRLLAMTVSVTLLMLLLMLLQDHVTVAAPLKVQAVVLGTGMLVTGVAAALGMWFGRTAPAAWLTTFAGGVLFASPFWGNLLVQWTDGAAKPWAIGFVVKATPLSACASAVGYDLFRGQMLYVLSAVSDHRHALPAWWAYALVTGAVGIALVALATTARRRPRAET